MRAKTFRARDGARVTIGTSIRGPFGVPGADVTLYDPMKHLDPFVFGLTPAQCRAIGERLIAIADAAKRGGDDAG